MSTLRKQSVLVWWYSLEMSKFAILAIARSGSTSLARLLGKCKDVHMAIEPFHPGYSSWNPNEPNYIDHIKDVDSLDKVVDELFKKHTAIKVLNYQIDTGLYKHLILRPGLKIVLLYRRNVVESVLSAEIAKQTNAWHKNELNETTKKAYTRLMPIDITLVQKHIQFISSQHSELLDFLKKNKAGNYIDLLYEKLYSEDLEHNTQTIAGICKFLDVAVPDKKYIDKYMRISSSKMNSRKQLEMIPNFREIRKAFGI